MIEQNGEYLCRVRIIRRGKVIWQMPGPWSEPGTYPLTLPNIPVEGVGNVG